MRAWHGSFATGALLVAGLASNCADNPQSPPATTQGVAGPATQPSSVALYVGQEADEWSSYQAMHAYILDRFVRSEGFGLSRMPRAEDAPRQRLIHADGARYLVGRVQLISLNEGKQPFVYVTKFRDASKNQIKHAEHLPLDATASTALDELKAGKEVVLARKGDDPELIGAVRATNACTGCHSVPQGTLLGAFLYPLKKERPGWRRKVSG